MNKQPEALRLADALDNCEPNFYGESSRRMDSKLAENVDSAAAELRRLHAINAELLKALVALEAMTERYRPFGYSMPDAQKQARAAIAKAGEQP